MQDRDQAAGNGRHRPESGPDNRRPLTVPAHPGHSRGWRFPRVDDRAVVEQSASAGSEPRRTDGLRSDTVDGAGADGQPYEETWTGNPSGTPSGPVLRVLSVAWALVPIGTVGLGTAPAFTFAAVRLRSRAVGWWAAFYWVCLVTALAFDRPLQGLPESSWRSQAQEWIQWIALILMGTTHAFLIRRQVLAGTGLSDGVDGAPSPLRRALGARSGAGPEAVQDSRANRESHGRPTPTSD